jgi:broad specificity phosphatase PhoE
MSSLLLVRHGQASFGSADYDRLSDLGRRQCEALGEHFAARDRRFAGVMRGTLRRHRESLDAIASRLPALPDAVEWPGLDEYDGEALVRALVGDALPAVDSAEGYRQHFRLLREALHGWMEGRLSPRGMPSWAEFAAGVAGALDHVRSRFDGDVLVVSSGGPISTAVAQVLGAPHPAVVELNLRLRNSALTEFAFTPRRHALVSFNAIPHLEQPGRDDWITFA